jgi:hypothetical protein
MQSMATTIGSVGCWRKNLTGYIADVLCGIRNIKHMYIQKNIPINHCNELYNYTGCRLFAIKRKRIAKALLALECGIKTLAITMPTA